MPSAAGTRRRRRPRCAVARVGATLAALVLAGAAREASAQAYDATPIQTSLAFEAPCTAEASTELRRGASLLFFVVHDAALVAFARAAELDPDCALAGWGEAMSLVRLPVFDTSEAAMTRGRAALGRARAASKALPRDTRLIGATQALFDQATSAPLRLKAFADGMHGLAHESPGNVLALGSAVLADLVRTTLPDDEPVRSARDRIAHAYAEASAMPAEIAFLRLLVADDAAGDTMAVATRLKTAMTPTPATAQAAARIFHRVGRWDDAIEASDTAVRIAGGWFEASMLAPVAWIGTAPEWAIAAAAQGGRRDRITAALHACGGALDAAGTAIDETLAPRVAWACGRAGIRAWWADLDWQSAATAPEPPLVTGGTQAAGGIHAIDVETTSLALLARGLQQARDAWPRGQPALIAGARSAMAALDSLAVAHHSQARDIELDRLLVAMALSGAYESRDEMLVHELQASEVERSLDVSRQQAPRLVGVNRLAGEIHLRLHDYRDAREHFARALERQPNDARALLGLARSAARLGDATASREAAAHFLALWSRADQGRGEVIDALRLAK